MPADVSGDPWALVAGHEASAGPAERVARGAWYTPREVVETLVALALPSASTPPRRILDPSCGGGAFLLGSLDRLVQLGLSPDAALERVAGIDIDAGAVGAADAAVARWADLHGVEAQSVARLGDALDHAGEPADLILGNPPFATPLKGTPLPAAADAQRTARPDRFGPYADLAAIHLASAWDRLAPGGRLVFVLPQSLLGSRDTAGLRTELEGCTTGAWASAERHFDANVRVWAPVLERTAPAAAGTSWGDRVADALGVPAAAAPSEALGHRIEATSGFRDEFYALARACRESAGAALADGELALCTVGALDPIDLLWGRRPTKLAKVIWQRPVVHLDDLDDRRSWVERLRRPKVLLPTQSRVLEPVMDPAGVLVPVTPVLAVWPAAGSDLGLAELAAVLLAPPVAAWALRRGFGTALSPDAIKLAARDLTSVPLPVDPAPWREAAALVPAGAPAVGEIGRLMTAAYRADEAVFTWWDRRRPRR